ncbi:MAG: terpene cyclase/mutase family protein, partial [Planctomycetes bacterium]|nr:terpene cyclase/mutase family protein [Planctomycetota bacterium]
RPDGAVGDKMPVALSALALMAHFAAGHAPDDVTHGEWLRRSLRRVLAGQHESGYFGAADNSRMYGHGIVTLMLAEALGMCRDDDLDETIRAALERAVTVTVKAARVAKHPGHEGGWHYQPDQGSSDLSLSGWQLMSLHATQQVGIAVPEEVVLAAVGYAKRLTSPDGKVGYDAPGSDHPALRGLAMLSLAIGGQGQAPEVARIADRIQSNPIAWQGPWFFYRAYYDSVGLSRAAPQQWQAYAQTLESVLVDHQQEDGSWPNPPGDNEGEHGGVYTTSMAVLALSVRKQLLPAYQR